MASAASPQRDSTSARWELRRMWSCRSYGIVVGFVVLVGTLFCLLYYDILQLTPPSGGLMPHLPSSNSLTFLASQAQYFPPISSLPPFLTPHNNTHHHHNDPLLVSPHPPSIAHSSSPPSIRNPSFLNYTPPSTILHPFLNLSQSNNASPPPSSTPPIGELSAPPPPPSSIQLSNHSSAPSSTHPIGELSAAAPPSSIQFVDGSQQQEANTMGERSKQVSPRGEEGLTRSWNAVAEEEKGGNERASEGKRGEEEERECNLYEGRWVKDESYPLYRSQACPFIDGGFRCQENGRPDQDYLRWRWQPSACNMPRFNGEDMLNRLRGSRLVFVGDSIGRNQWESLLCMLAKAVKKKTRIYEKNGEPITKHKGFLIFKFEAYNCTIEYYRSPFLVPQARPHHNHPQGVRTTLRVDTMDWTSNQWLGANIIVFNAGHWWSYEKTIRGGCYFQVGNKVNKSMSVKDGFGRAMETWRQWVTSNIDPLKTQLFFRTYSPVHFSGGTWKLGGRCDGEREPHAEGSKFGGEPWTNGVVISQAEKVPDVTLLDVTHLSNYRKDAHSSIYVVDSSKPRPINRQDCSHWCLPGLPDTWNELLYATLLQAGKGPWRSHHLPSL